MCRHRQFQRLVLSAFLEADMAALLPDNHPAIPLESANEPGVGQTGDLGHTAISSSSAPGEYASSSSTGSRYNSMASRMFFNASSLESPSLIHPGNEGTIAVKPPSSLGSRTIFSFMAKVYSYPRRRASARILANVSFTGARYEHPVQALVRILSSLTAPQRSRRNVVSSERIASSRALQRKPPSQSGHLHILIRLRDLRVSVRVKSSSAVERNACAARVSETAPCSCCAIIRTSISAQITVH